MENVNSKPEAVVNNGKEEGKKHKSS
jgi:hypothetical protein